MNMCDTNPAALLRAQNTGVYVTSHLTRSRRGSGAVIVASRKSGTVIASRNTGIETCCQVEQSSEWKAWSGELRETLVSSLSREKAKQSDSD